MATLLLQGFTSENNQNQQTWSKIKTAAIFHWITFLIWNLQQAFLADRKIKKNYLYHVTKLITSSATF